MSDTWVSTHHHERCYYNLGWCVYMNWCKNILKQAICFNSIWNFFSPMMNNFLPRLKDHDMADKTSGLSQQQNWWANDRTVQQVATHHHPLKWLNIEFTLASLTVLSRHNLTVADILSWYRPISDEASKGAKELNINEGNSIPTWKQLVKTFSIDNGVSLMG